jgi:hypothetical protein
MMAGMARQAGGNNGWMSAMQKMQAAAGGKPLGPNGMPSQQQIEAMRVSRFCPWNNYQAPANPSPEGDAPRDAPQAARRWSAGWTEDAR